LSSNISLQQTTNIFQT